MEREGTLSMLPKKEEETKEEVRTKKNRLVQIPLDLERRKRREDSFRN